ncbi:hypothetical protein [Frankia sp. B2]|uniref:hypothetical protein n=1 Tax=Frankia sp. B2 TaxID=2541730 RepID=UPI00197AE1E2|nr:hypothetical protein [Frankia sp. B2]
MNGQYEWEPTALDLAGVAFDEAADSGRYLLDLVQVQPDIPAGRMGLREVRALLAGSTPRGAWRAAVWRELSHRQGDEGWVSGAVGVALPALRLVAAGLAGDDPAIRADLDGEVVTGFLAALRRLAPEAPLLEVRLLWAAYRTGLAYAAVHGPLLPVGTCVPTSAGVPPRPWGTGLRPLLAAATRGGVLVAGEVELLWAVRGEGRSPAELSTEQVPGEEWALRLCAAELALMNAVLSGRLAPAGGDR